MPATFRTFRQQLDPDYKPPEPPPPAVEPACICRVLDATGENPTCPTHAWWTRDPDVLHLADLTRELGSAWEAARRHADNLNREAE